MQRMMLGPALALVACSRMAIDGQLVDAKGTPIVGARVAAMGASPCMASTDAEGHFELPCPVGSYTIVMSAEGYTSEEVQLDASERKRYELGRTVLVKIPDDPGLYLFAEDAYVEMPPGALTRKVDKRGSELDRSVCLDESRSTPTAVKAGARAFFDYEHPGWRPLKLDAEGCAYRDTRDAKGRWNVTYREKAEFEKRTLNRGKTIVLMHLEPGRYFIADWKGFFVPISEREDRHSYSGHLLVVQ